MKILLSCIAVVILGASAFGQQAKNVEAPLAPTFTAAAMDGKIYNLQDLRGKVVVLNLWFINCPNCIEEIKLLNKVVDEYKDNKDVVFLALAVNKKPDLEKFLKKYPFKYQVIPNAANIILFKYGEAKKGGEFYVPFPMHVLIDKQGRMVTKVEGIKGVEAVKKELKNQFASKAAASK